MGIRERMRDRDREDRMVAKVACHRDSLCAAASPTHSLFSHQARLKEMKLKKKMQAKLAASGVPDYVYLNLQPQCFVRW
jgi:hypothetical protein